MQVINNIEGLCTSGIRNTKGSVGCNWGTQRHQISGTNDQRWLVLRSWQCRAIEEKTTLDSLLNDSLILVECIVSVVCWPYSWVIEFYSFVKQRPHGTSSLELQFKEGWQKGRDFNSFGISHNFIWSTELISIEYSGISFLEIELKRYTIKFWCTFHLSAVFYCYQLCGCNNSFGVKPIMNCHSHVCP